MSLGNVLIDSNQQPLFGKRQHMNNYLPRTGSAPRQKHSSSRVRQWLLALLLVPVMVQALPSDRQEPINISSDTADADAREGVSIYRGDVVVTQGTTRITGDIVRVYTNNREVSKVVAEGNGGGRRAYYEEMQSNDQGKLQAWGEVIRYDIDGDQIELIKNAKLTQKGDVFIGEKIDYSPSQQTVNARGAPEQGESGRVQMVLQPRQKRDDSTP